jgi:uncharacterized repeat protein (TIGR03803 family)
MIRRTDLIFGLLCVIAITRNSSAASGFQELYVFPKPTLGYTVSGTTLLELPDGNLYGTTAIGGDVGSNSPGDGFIFRATKSGALTILCYFSLTNGSRPAGGVVMAAGNLYGVTMGGGTNYVDPLPVDDGTIFKVTTNGVLTSLLSFDGTNGMHPVGPLVPGTDGKLYGTTEEGGLYGLGTIFRISTNGIFESLVSFNGTNGNYPYGNLVLGNDSRVYGTTIFGGSNFSGPYTGLGTVFALNTNGTLSTLHFFQDTDGARPYAGLCKTSDGRLWGATSGGGIWNRGTVFRMGTNGSFESVFSFNGTNGSTPFSRLEPGPDRSLYGTTGYSYVGPNIGNGTIFRITEDGALTTLVWLNGTNGATASSMMTLSSDGSFYGAMSDAAGNALYNGGTLFRLLPVPALTSIAATPDGVTLTWNSFSNTTYQVESSSTLSPSDWTVLANDVMATSNRISFTDGPALQPEQYYRVGLTY